RGLNLLDNVKFVNRLAYLIGGLAVFILLFSWITYIVQNWFRIERITIKGNIQHVTSEQLSYIARNRLKGTFFTLDINNLQEEFRKVPWVKTVTVEREFPDAITVNIVEYQAIGRWGDDGLLSGDGRIFSGADDSTSLPIFLATKPQVAEVLQDYTLIQDSLAKHKLSLTQLYLSGSGITKLYLSNNLHIIVCGANFAQKWQRLMQYWDKLYQLNPNLSYINMCYKNAMAINSASATSTTRSIISGATKGR
ncbi:MAG: cell division protein FtsQ/DivIB, partial [Burkholderiales bacterium]